MAADNSRVKLKVIVDNTKSSSEDESESDTEDSSSSSSSSRSSHGSQSDSDDKSDITEVDTVVVAADNNDRIKAPKNNLKVYENKAGTFVTGFDPLSKEFVERQEKRVKRFGKNADSGGMILTEEAVEKLYKSLGVSADSEETRFDAIHIRGVNDLSTERVFDYFREFGPTAIEWIDDATCNVVWMDKISASRALLKLSSDPKEQTEIVTEDTTEDKTDGAEDAETGDTSDTSDDRGDTEKEKSAEVVNNESAAAETIEDDDELNLMSEDEDEAKMSLSFVTAEESKAAKLKRSEQKNSSKLTEEEEERMEVDESSGSEDEKHSHKKRSFKPVPINVESSDGQTKLKTSKRRSSLKEEIKEDLPPGIWRVGVPHARARRLYLRFATKDDKKQPGAGSRSRYYQKYGNPNFGGMKGLISNSRKRKIISKSYQSELIEAKKAVEKSVEKSEWKRGVPETTKFDKHIEEMEQRRSKSARQRIQKYSDPESSLDELVVDEGELGRLLEPPEPKRTMRMHADDIDNSRSISSRLGARSSAAESGNIKDRLGSVPSRRSPESSRSSRIHSSGDLRNRLVGDLRSRLNNRR